MNFLTAPFYLFDEMDTLDKIHRPSLVPVTRAAIRDRGIDGGGQRGGDAGGRGHCVASLTPAPNPVRKAVSVIAA